MFFYHYNIVQDFGRIGAFKLQKIQYNPNTVYMFQPYTSHKPEIEWLFCIVVHVLLNYTTVLGKGKVVAFKLI